MNLVYSNRWKKRQQNIAYLSAFASDLRWSRNVRKSTLLLRDVTTDQKRKSANKLLFVINSTSIRKTCLPNRYKCTHEEAKSSKKGKVIPLQARCGPEGG